MWIFADKFSIIVGCRKHPTYTFSQIYVTKKVENLLSYTNSFLYQFTHIQLNFYAKVNNPDDVRIDDTLGTAVCEDEQEKEYGGVTTILFTMFSGVIPFWVIILLPMMVYSIWSKIYSAMEKQQNHADFAGLALTGLVFSTLVLVPDGWALVLVIQGKQDFDN